MTLTRRLLLCVSAVTLLAATGCGPRVERTESVGLANLERLLATPSTGQAAAPAVTGNSPDAGVPASGAVSSGGEAVAVPGVASAVPSARSTPVSPGAAAAPGAAANRSASTPQQAGSRPAAAAGPGPAGAHNAAPAGAGANLDPAKAPVILGHIGEYSGIAGGAFASGLPMAGIAVRWLNDHGGFNGHPIKLITADDQSDPSRYAALAKQMVERDGVIAFLGNVVPLSAEGAAQYLDQRGVPVIGGDSAPDTWWRHPMMFPDGSRLENLALGLMQYAARESKPKMAILWCAESETCSSFNRYMSSDRAKRTGAELVYSTRISIAQPDFTTECLQAKQRGAQAIMLAMDPNSMNRTARSCLQQGYSPLWMSAGLSVDAGIKNDPNLDGLVGTQPVFPWPASDSPATQEFQNAVKKYAPSVTLGGAGSVVWAAGMLLRHIAPAVPDPPTSQGVANALWTVRGATLDGLTPPLTYEKGKPYDVQNCYFVVQAKNGNWLAPFGSKPQCIDF